MLICALPDKLAVEGGSNGGLLMGAFHTQDHGLARAVIAHVGICDMLRVDLDPNGAFNVTEFGTVKDPAQFRALRAHSPFHNVTDGVKYPAVFFLAGEKDGGVNPSNSRKMSARLQAATASANPILVRLSGASGHGMGTALSERIAHQADVFAFLYRQLGMKAEAQQRRWSASLGVRFFRSQASIAVHAETRAERRIPPVTFHQSPVTARKHTARAFSYGPLPRRRFRAIFRSSGLRRFRLLRACGFRGSRCCGSASGCCGPGA